MHISNIDWGGGGATSKRVSVTHVFHTQKVAQKNVIFVRVFCALTPDCVRAQDTILIVLLAPGGAVGFFIAGFVANLPIWWPWATHGHRTL